MLVFIMPHQVNIKNILLALACYLLRQIQQEKWRVTISVSYYYCTTYALVLHYQKDFDQAHFTCSDPLTLTGDSFVELFPLQLTLVLKIGIFTQYFTRSYAMFFYLKLFFMCLSMLTYLLG